MTGSTTDRTGALEHRGSTVASVQPERCGTNLDAAPAGIKEATTGLRSRPAEHVAELEEQEARNAVFVIR